MPSDDIIRLLMAQRGQPFGFAPQSPRFNSMPMSGNVEDRRLEQPSAPPSLFGNLSIPTGPWPMPPSDYQYRPPPLSAPSPPPQANTPWPFVGINKYNEDVPQAANQAQFNSVLRRLMGLPDADIY